MSKSKRKSGASPAAASRTEVQAAVQAAEAEAEAQYGAQQQQMQEANGNHAMPSLADMSALAGSQLQMQMVAQFMRQMEEAKRDGEGQARRGRATRVSRRMMRARQRVSHRRMR